MTKLGDYLLPRAGVYAYDEGEKDYKLRHVLCHYLFLLLPGRWTMGKMGRRLRRNDRLKWRPLK
jgi:hypothetical protein